MEEIKYTGNVTDIGRAKLTKALQTGEMVKITHIAIGDGGGGVPEPTSDVTELIGEVWRAEADAVEIDGENKSVLWVRGCVPENGPGDFWIREMGAFDQDGDLIAYTPVPEAYKPNKTAGATTGFYIDMAVITSSIAAIEVTVDTGGARATRRDIWKHNESESAHPDLRAAMEQLADDGGSATVARHNEDGEAHRDIRELVEELAVALEKLTVITEGLSTSNTNLTIRVSALENLLSSNLEENRHSVYFSSHEAVELERGNYNAARQQIESTKGE